MLKGKTPLVVALVLGLLAAAFGLLVVENEKRKTRAGWTLVPVVVAKQDIPEGTEMTMEMMAQRDMPEQFVTRSVIRPDNWQYIVKQTVLVPVQKGDPLLWTQFETTKAAERLSTKVQKKTRAVTIETSNSTSVGGWVRPNDHVDVIGTFRDPASNDKIAVTLLQDVIVLATGKITGTTNVNLVKESDREYNHVTLLVLPEEAEILMLARDEGKLSLSLRHEEDMDRLQERGRATNQSLLSGERMRALERRRHDVIDVIRGSGSSGASAVAGPK